MAAQLQKVFTALDFQSPGFDWSVLRVALETVGHFLDRIDQISEEQYSTGFSDVVDSAELEEAVLVRSPLLFTEISTNMPAGLAGQ